MWRLFWRSWAGASAGAFLPSYGLNWSASGGDQIDKALAEIKRDNGKGSPAVARAIISGDNVMLGGVSCRFPKPTSQPLRSWPISWEREFHSFAWLNHLEALMLKFPEDRLRVQLWLARFMLDYLWILSSASPRGQFKRAFKDAAWSPWVCAQRSSYWLLHADQITSALAAHANQHPASAKQPHTNARRESARRESARQKRATLSAFAKFLRRQVLFTRGDWRFGIVTQDSTAIKVAFLDAALRSHRPRLALAAGRALDKFLSMNLLSDGLMRDLSPLSLVNLIRDLRAVSSLGFTSYTKQLALAVKALSAMLHQDKRLAVFHSSHQGSAADILRLTSIQRFIKKAKLEEVFDAQIPFHLKSGGFVRLTNGATLVIMDCSKTASALAFEASVGENRIICNCGSYPFTSGLDRATLSALRGTAAHSTLVVQQANVKPTRVNISPFDKATRTASVSEASHDGYLKRFGIGHTRKLQIEADGTLLGTDRLTGAAGRDFELFFHLHPNCEAIPLASKRDVVIRIAKKQVWRFCSPDVELSLLPSVYCGLEGSSTPTLAICIRGKTAARLTTLSWSLYKLKDSDT